MTGQLQAKEGCFFVWIQHRTNEGIDGLSLVVTDSLPIELFPSNVEGLISPHSEPCVSVPSSIEPSLCP